jgi:hypothetical protein
MRAGAGAVILVLVAALAVAAAAAARTRTRAQKAAIVAGFPPPTRVVLSHVSCVGYNPVDYNA